MERISTANSSQNGAEHTPNTNNTETAPRGGIASHPVLSQLDALMATNYLHTMSASRSTNQRGGHAEAYGETKTGDSELTYTQDSVEPDNDHDHDPTGDDDADQLRSSSSFTPLQSMPLADVVRLVHKPSVSSSSSSAAASPTPTTSSHAAHDRAAASSFDQWKQKQFGHPSPTPSAPPTTTTNTNTNTNTRSQPRTPGNNNRPSPGGIHSNNFMPFTPNATAGGSTAGTTGRTTEEEEERWGQFLARVQRHEKQKQKCVVVPLLDPPFSPSLTDSVPALVGVAGCLGGSLSVVPVCSPS